MLFRIGLLEVKISLVNALVFHDAISLAETLFYNWFRMKLQQINWNFQKSLSRLALSYTVAPKSHVCMTVTKASGFKARTLCIKIHQKCVGVNEVPVVAMWWRR